MAAMMRRGFLLRLVLAGALLAWGALAGAADHYVRAGAGGEASGADWANAWPKLPDSLVRGDTYYVGAGAYPAYHFNEPENGTGYVTVRKATAAAHGTETGWQAAYGEGAASWGPISISRSYFIFDGATGSGTSGYGFKVSSPVGGDSLIEMTDAPSYIKILHVDVGYPSRDLEPSADGIYGNTPVSHIVIAHCYIHDTPRCPLLMRYWRDLLFEYNWVARNKCTPEIHSEGVSTHGGGDFIFRYNTWEDIEGTAVIVNLDAPTRNWEIYGNVFFYTGKAAEGLGHGIVSDNFGNSGIKGLKYYNNTAYNLTGGGAGLQFWSDGSVGIEAFDNLWYKCDNVSFNQIRHDYNYYSDTTFAFTYRNNPGRHDIVTSGDPFVDAAKLDFRLKAHTDPGTPLPALYGKDMEGVKRGADGSWDRGAYEFIDQTPRKAPTPPRIKTVALDADPDRPGLQVYAGDVVTLAGSAEGVEGEPLSWEWRCFKEGGEEVLCAQGCGPVEDVTQALDATAAGQALTWNLKVSGAGESAESELAMDVIAPAASQVTFANFSPPGEDQVLPPVSFSASVLAGEKVQSVALWGNWSGTWRKELIQSLEEGKEREVLSGGDFESFASNLAQGWQCAADGEVVCTLAADAGQSGQAQRIDLATSGTWGVEYSRPCPLATNGRYRLSFYYKTSGADGIRLSVAGFPGQVIALEQDLAGTGGAWKPGEAEFTNPAEDPALIRIAANSPGSVWLDSFSVKELPNRYVKPSFSVELARGEYEWALEVTGASGPVLSPVQTLMVATPSSADRVWLESYY